MSKFTIELLHSKHKKEDFTCGIELLDAYLHKQAKQDVKRKLAACYVLANSEDNVLGYYTLSNASIPQKWIPEEFARRMPPSYTNLPVTLLGRLAVSKYYRGQGLGKYLLVDAARRSLQVSSQVGSMALVADPINLDAVQFYKKYGFIFIQDTGKMFLPMKTIQQLFSS